MHSSPLLAYLTIASHSQGVGRRALVVISLDPVVLCVVSARTYIASLLLCEYPTYITISASCCE